MESSLFQFTIYVNGYRRNCRSFNQADFRELDRALKRLNNNENIKKRKLHPSSEDYYFSFGLSSGIEARIFYRLLPKDFGNRRRVITQIIKQYHTRFVN